MYSKKCLLWPGEGFCNVSQQEGRGFPHADLFYRDLNSNIATRVRKEKKEKHGRTRPHELNIFPIRPGELWRDDNLRKMMTLEHAMAPEHTARHKRYTQTSVASNGQVTTPPKSHK